MIRKVGAVGYGRVCCYSSLRSACGLPASVDAIRFYSSASHASLYIRTFGCQMNEYDSAKMVDVLRESQGYELTDDPAQADLLLLNTCSVREKAQEKVFSQLGGWKQLKKAKPHLLIGVGGCVASQEGDGITQARAVRGSRVRPADAASPAGDDPTSSRRTGRSVVDVSFPEIEKFDALPEPRAEGATAFVSIMEGCSKYCTFCVVPYTRGEEVSRPFESVHGRDPQPRAAGRARDQPARARTSTPTAARWTTARCAISAR